jgi:Ni/Fe-hydrogenase subunit HybB-like protein
VLLGFVAHRINTAVTSMEHWGTRMYVPSWQELAITMGLVAFGFVAFTWISKNFNVFQEHAQGRKVEPVEEPAAQLEPATVE